ncbi:hypothetical protein AB0K51_05020 [Kitasatospora sp. NPDC049285]|uniref:hypothetical protein n=1 Tax=Kitasatospora sp. NPDC049285 TaxID=3157096 RepID=UPI00342BD5A1
MVLRAELLPPAVDRRRLDETEREIGRIEELVRKDDASAPAEIAAFNARTGHTYLAVDFAAYEGSRSLAAFALEAARPARPRVAGVTRPELVELVRLVQAAGPESAWYLRALQANVSHPRVADLLFHPPLRLRHASPERIVEELLRYRSLAF